MDGFIAVVAHTIVIGASPTNKVTGRKADVILAAHYASEGALRLLKPGNEVCCCLLAFVNYLLKRIDLYSVYFIVFVVILLAI